MQHRISTTPELRMAMALNRARMIAAHRSEGMMDQLAARATIAQEATND